MYNHVNKMVIGYGNEAWGRSSGVAGAWTPAAHPTVSWGGVYLVWGGVYLVWSE